MTASHAYSMLAVVLDHGSSSRRAFRWFFSVAAALALPSGALLQGGCRCKEPQRSAGQQRAADARDETRDDEARAGELLEEIQRLEWRRADDAVISEALADRDAEVRGRAALAIGRSVLGSHLQRLGRRLGRETDPQVRSRIVFALRLLALDSNRSDTAGEVARVLAARLSYEKDPRVRREVIVSLGWTGEPAIAGPTIERLLRGQTSDGKQGDAEQREALLTAAGLLGYRGKLDKKARASLAGVLLPWLAHAQPRLRRLACWARARLGQPPGVEAIAILRRVADETVDRSAVAVEARAWAVRAVSGKQTSPEIVDWLAAGRLHDPAVPPQVEAIRALARGGPRGVLRLCSGLPRLWRSIGQSHYRLIGRRLRSMLVALDVLQPHAKLATVKRFARDMLELSDASDAAVRYSPVEAHSVDLVHCAAARLADLGLGRPEHSTMCGTARAEAVTAVMRRTWLARLIGRMERPAAWKLTLLRRYLGDEDVAVRSAAVEALGGIDGALIEVPLRDALADPDPGVLSAAAEVLAKRGGTLGQTERQQIAARLVERLKALKPLRDPEPICQLARALAALGQTERLQSLLRSPALAVRACVHETLGGRRAPGTPGRRLSRGLPQLRWAGDRPPPREAVIVTHKGEIRLELDAEQTPATVANLARLATRRFYRGVRFHRVVAAFVVQGGDPRGDGRGGPGYTIPCELTPRPYVRGSVGMALAGRDTGGSQFFITLTRQPHLDGRYTQFGRVTRGMDIVDRLQEGDEIKDLYIP